MYIDEKVTVWNRTQLLLSQEDEEKLVPVIKKMLSEGKTIDKITSELEIDCDYETLLDTSEEITPQDNEGQPTVEAYDEHGNMFFNNQTT